ncbi:MAG: long-chain fatty acid--CoA ligase [Desulfobacteraceae bacterium]|nr:AMP-binding protein [Desulfobacteraceae bacterium]MBC2754452.1 long-chain fatty acid--CoA ligase [Desulfobacteraceae bacterium]
MTKNFNAWPEQWPKNLNYPDKPIHYFLENTAERVPNRIAIHFGGMVLTYGELKILVDRFATALAGLGIEKGERFAIHLPNMPQFAIAYYAVLKIGAVFTPLSPLLSPREVTHQLNDSGAKTLLSMDLLYPGIESIIPETKVARVISTSIGDCYNSIIAPLKPIGKLPVPNTLDMAELIKNNEPNPPEVAIDIFKDLAHLAYTGGTTGVSKGVMLTHQNVTSNTLQFGCWFNGAQLKTVGDTVELIYPEGVDPIKDRPVARDIETALVVVPWFHAMGTIGYLNNMVSGGTTMVVFPRFEATEYIEAVKKFSATTLGGAPQLYVPLLNMPGFEDYDLSGIKLIASGAAPLPLTILDSMKKSFTSSVVIEAYGLTECAMGAICNPPIPEKTKAGSVGLPVFDTECKVVDTNTGEDLPPGKEGEICIKGPQVMVGYWNRPEATAEVLKDGWLYTGDIGKEDEDGYFYITDRIKDLILYKGYNVYPREIEEILFTHPAIEMCGIVGKPDEKAGELPVAFVQLKAGQQATAEELIEYVNSKVAAYKKLREVTFTDLIPVSPAGKVLKRELRDQLTGK